MKVIICNEIRENDKEYFKLAWRIPFEQLIDIGWYSIDQSKISGKPSDFFIENFNKLPTVLLFWNTNTFVQKNINDILDNNWIKCIYFDDLHQTSGRIINFRNLIIKHFDYIFSTYAYVFDKFFAVTSPEKIIWYPHSVNNKFTVDFNKNPINKILLTGCIEKNIYPFRNYVNSLSKKYPIVRLEQIYYNKQNHDIIGHNYIKHINKYIASVACCSNEKTPYIVSKFFEIPASGALLIAYDEFVVEPLQHLGFMDGINYISVNYKNIEEKIMFITDSNNKELIDKIRFAGYSLVWKNHTLLNRTKLIDDIVNKT